MYVLFPRAVLEISWDGYSCFITEVVFQNEHNLDACVFGVGEATRRDLSKKMVCLASAPPSWWIKWYILQIAAGDIMRAESAGGNIRKTRGETRSNGSQKESTCVVCHPTMFREVDSVVKKHYPRSYQCRTTQNQLLDKKRLVSSTAHRV